MANHFPSLLSQTPPHQCQRPHSSRILFFAIHKGGPGNCHISGSRSRMLHVQTRHKISISQCSRPGLWLGTSGYEMGRALFLQYGPPFGLRWAAFLFDEFSSTLEWIIQSKLKYSQGYPYNRWFLFCYLPSQINMHDCSMPNFGPFHRSKYPHRKPSLHAHALNLWVSN